MADQFKNDLLKEAIRIGDDILQKAKTDKNGTYWETLTSFEEGGEYKTKLYVADSIYSGSAGIILFLIELHKKTNDIIYYNTVKDAAKWLVKYSEENEMDYYAFFTGRMGVAYTLVKCSLFLKDDSLKKAGLDLAKDCGKFLISERPVDDLINGYSGALIGLMHLHVLTNESWLLEKVNDYADILIKRANLGLKGLYWDRSHQQVRGLCGFSHGAAGIGAAFLELGKYFNNTAFYSVAEQAFLYETEYYDKERGNWPDFRKGFYSEKDFNEAEAALKENNLEHFTSSSDMNAWCHGAAGIGLSRLRAYDLLKDETYKLHAEQAVAKTVVTDVSFDFPTRTYTLCHGGGGNSDLFIEAYLQFGDKKYLGYANTVGEKILESVASGKKYQPGLAHATEEDLSLFMGNAGIGYFLLRLIDPENVRSIEFPRVEKQYQGEKISGDRYKALLYTNADINEIYIDKTFKKTFSIVNTIAKDETKVFLSGLTKFDKNAFPDFIKKISGKLDKTVAEKLLELLKLEERKVECEDHVESSALLYAKQYFLIKEIETLLKRSDEELLHTKFVLDKGIVLMNLKYDWSALKAEEPVLDAVSEEENLTLLLPNYQGIAEWKVSPLVDGIISTLKKSMTLDEIRKEVSEMFDAPTNENEAKMISDSILNQTKELIKYGIIQQDMN